ncbi:hypothetical protein [Ralstonia pseudosolanacearum]|uniref:hypothetical protein n=1 Tax=Ralstonia pseudosolanacearum TaxID=1310165 RepID=UPI001FFA0DC5|nr:hypothetical protein [Ralstonia pseudosolanacearum]
MSNKFKVGDKVIVKAGRERGFHDKFTVQAGVVYTVKSIASTGGLRFAEKDKPAAGEYAPPAHDPVRFELASAQAVPAQEFKSGDKVRCIDNDNGLRSGIKVGSEYEVQSTEPGGYVMLKGVFGDYYARRFELVPEVPRDFRVRRSGTIGSTPYKTTEDAAEAGRKNYSDNVEFEVVEVVVVSKNVVRKIVEARA